MTDRELLKRINDLFMNKTKWSGNPNFGNNKAYVTFVIKDYADIVINLGNQLKQPVCERCGEVNPAEIHTCTPKQEEGCAECGKLASEGWALYCVKCSEPVAIVTSDFDGGNKSIKFLNDFAYTNLMQKTLLYTAPPQREWQGLTDEEIGSVIEASQITLKNYCSEDKQTEYARAIEAKLKEKNT